MVISYAVERTARGRKTGRIIARCGRTTATAPTKPEAMEALLTMLVAAAENTRHDYLFTRTGEVLTVRYAFGSWGYDIVRPEGRSSCWGGAATQEEVVESAKQHAEQSYGGIVATATGY